jgi:hypothetical protein
MLLLCAGVDYKVFGTSKRFNAAEGSGASYHSDYFANMDASAFREMRAHPQFRVLFDETAPWPTISRHWYVTTPQGFDPFITTQYRAMLGDGATFRSERELDIDASKDDILQLLGVRYLITGDTGKLYAVAAGNPKFRLLGSNEPFYKVFEYVNAKPAFGGDGNTELLTWTPETRAFRINAPQAGRATLSEQLLPGWSARVDGREVDIERWNGAFQSVAIPPGQHEVEFRYRSTGLIRGAGISLLSIVALLVFIKLSARHKDHRLKPVPLGA